MSTATTFIPTFAAITLILGGANELSVQLILIGVLAIILHTTLTPADFSNPYPNFDNYHPTDPPLRDYVLVFGLVTLMLIALISRVHPLLWSLVRATWRALVARQASAPLDRSVQVQDATVDLGLCSTPHNSPSSPSTSHTLTNQWTATTSTLADGSPTLITPQAIGVTDSSETATLKNRVSQLEAELEELRCRMKVLSTGEKVFTEPSPSPIDPDLTPFASLGSVDAREHLRSLVEFAAEGTRQTDQLILKMRTILSEADKIDDTAFEACQVGGGTLPVPPTSRSTQSPLSEHLPTTPTTRRVRDTPPPLSAAEAAKAPGTPSDSGLPGPFGSPVLDPLANGKGG
ncbi:hypothetical protein BDM02DRAFT_1685664 [Thelephora ganbajun]|uniref:Uncharacterized protein n=1 Tax=Thelephora ganbajun TaxID=370292 RepID=A0ACB6ZKK8_THEGA|nr:hypothetical protein BDM02DRAFT_1685664 [Thelephora ganbajun]